MLVVATGIAGLFFVVTNRAPAPVAGAAYADLYGTCEVSESFVAIGNGAATQLLAADASRQWAIVQQPLNASNTVALSLAGSAVIGHGYELPNATSSNPMPEFRYGFGTETRSGNALTARTGTGSTTIKVMQCSGRARNVN